MYMYVHYYSVRAPLFPPYELLYNDDIRRLKFSFLENDKNYDYTCRVYTRPYMYLYNYIVWELPPFPPYQIL